MRLFIVLIILFSFSSINYAQNEIIVPDYAESGQFLDDIVNGDTTATGQRNNPDAIYVLKRDGIYFTANSIRNIGWTLRVQGAEGTGNMPIVYAFKNPSTAAYAGEIFNVQGDLYVKDVALMGYTEIIADEYTTVPPRVINVAAAGPSVEVDNCILNGARFGTIATNSAATKVKVTNSVFAMCGNLWNTNIGNGRPFDLRNVSVDSMIVQNCTMLDITDRAIRHYASVASIGDLVFDHNTVYNEMAMHGCLGLGFVGNSVQITNNLFVDNFILGNDSTDGVRASEFGDPGERGPSGQFRMTFVGSVPNDSTQWTIKNNYYSVSSAVQAFYDGHTDAGIGNLIPLTWHINSKLGADSVNAFVKDDVTLVKTTRSLTGMATWYWLPDPNGPGKQKANTGFSVDVDFERLMILDYKDLSKLDLSYQTSATAYTGAAGYPAGDLNWFPDKKAEWIDNPTSVEIVNGLPTKYYLEQNYPNPFNPSTKITYYLPENSEVTLTIYNSLGKEVVTLVNNQEQNAGRHDLVWNAGKSLSSGVYFYQLKAKNVHLTKKLLLLK